MTANYTCTAAGSEKQERKTETNEMEKTFLKTLSSYYQKKDLSDKVLYIVEDSVDKTETTIDFDHQNGCKMQFGVSSNIISFPVHSLVLCINSSFFKKLLVDSNMKEARENKIVLHVNPGDKEYVKLLINSFYNFNVLNNIDTFKLLKILEYGDRYMCDALIKQGLTLIKNLNVTTLTECNALLDRLQFFECSLGHILEKDFFSNVKSRCDQFLIKTFNPIERTIFDKQHNSLSFSSLWMLLKSNDSFAFSENSVVTFLLKWFEADESRQTEKNIETLLSECRYEHMDVPFLTNGLSHTNPILSKWSGYLNWYIKAIAYPSSVMCYKESDKRKNRSLSKVNGTNKILSNKFSNPFQVQENVNFPNQLAYNDLWYGSQRSPYPFNGTNAYAHSLQNQSQYNKDICLEYSLEMKFNVSLQKLTTDKKILYNGYVLQPIITLCPNKRMDLEMHLDYKNQEKELKNFLLEIPLGIEISKKTGTNTLSTPTSYPQNILLTNQLVIKFCNSSIATTTLGNTQEAHLTIFRTEGILAAFKFTH